MTYKKLTIIKAFRISVEEFATFSAATSARNLILLDLEFVIVRQLLALEYSSQRKDYNMLVSQYVYYL